VTREFASQKALIAYAEQNDLAYEYEYTPAFAKWQGLLSPEQYELVEIRTSRGVSRVMLFSKAIIQAEWEANAPLREAMATKRERLPALRAKRAAGSWTAKTRWQPTSYVALGGTRHLRSQAMSTELIVNAIERGRLASS
jgi:hypothetical protein